MSIMPSRNSYSDAPTIPATLAESLYLGPFDEGGRREDGQLFLLQVAGRNFVINSATRHLIDLLLENRHHRLDGIAEQLGKRVGFPITAVELRDEVIPSLPEALFDEASPRLSVPLHLRILLLPAPLIRPLLNGLVWLFHPVAGGIAALGCLVSLGYLLIQPSLLADATGADFAIGVGICILGMVIHEFGHASACVRYGARQEGIGAGIYWIFPVLYAHVDDAWRLTRRQRAAVDIGGVYFQSFFLIAFTTTHFLTGAPLAGFVAYFTGFLMLYTLNPALKFDGYWLLSDLSGIYNLHGHVRSKVCDILRACRMLPPTECDGMLRWQDILLVFSFITLSAAFFAYVLRSLSVFVGSGVASMLHEFALLPALSGPESWRSLLPWLGWAGHAALVVLFSVLALYVSMRISKAISGVFRTEQSAP